jgi:hypothetical protein
MNADQIREYLAGMAATIDDPSVMVLGRAIIDHVKSAGVSDGELPAYLLSLLDGIGDTAATLRDKIAVDKSQK